jgi:hypothetical protein
VVGRILERHAAAEGPAEQVYRLALGQQAALGQQRVEVVGEVPHPAARVHRGPLGPAEAPQVGGDAAEVPGQRRYGPGEEPGRGNVAVHQHQRRRAG